MSCFAAIIQYLLNSTGTTQADGKMTGDSSSSPSNGILQLACVLSCAVPLQDMTDHLFLVGCVAARCLQCP
jgi:hypothetical protein